MPMLRLLKKIVIIIEKQPFSLPLFCTTFLALILLRIGIESALGSFESQSFSFLFFEFAHTFLFFLFAFLCLLPIVRFTGVSSLTRAANLLLFGFLIILTPPVVDAIVFHGGISWSFYKFDSLSGLLLRFFTFFGDRPDIGITYGVRFEVFMVIIGIGLSAYLHTRKRARVLLAMLTAYLILFILGTFPSYLTLLIQGLEKGLLSITASDIAGLFLSPTELFSQHGLDIRSTLNIKMSLWYASLLIIALPVLIFYFFRPLFRALFRNARWPQVFYHGGLLFLGGLLAWHFATPTVLWSHFHFLSIFILVSAVECAWFASVIVNDCFDITIDEQTNPNRPLISKTIDPLTYRTIGWLLFFASIFLAALVNFSATLILILYQAIAWIYSAPPFRLKRVPVLATFLAGIDGILILLIGFMLISPQHTFALLPPTILIFLFLAYTFALPIKDFKDIAGDRSDHVLTFPVLLGEERARLVFGSIFFLLFIMSVFTLHLYTAFFSALIFGSASFGIIQIARTQHPWCSYTRLPWYLLSLITGYGCILWWLII